MTRDLTDPPRLAGWRRGALVIAALLALALTSWLGQRLFDQLAELRSAPRDNAQWTLSQIEADVLHLDATMMRARLDEASSAQVRRRFDLLFSRAAMLRQAEVFRPLRQNDAINPLITGLLASMDRAAALVDRDDRTMMDDLPALAAEVVQMRTLARSLALEGVVVFADLSDRRREEFVRLLGVAFGVAFALIVALGVTLVILWRQATVSTRRAWETLRSRQRLAATVDASLDAIVVVDGSGVIRAFNKAAEQTFGLRADIVIGANAVDMLAPMDCRALLRRAMRRCFAASTAERPYRGRIETHGLRADGDEFPVELSIGGAMGDDGPILIGFLRDISERVRAEKALLAARDAALAADSAKSKFIAVMSHEMRTPLNGVVGALDMLGQTTLDHRQARFVQTALASADVLGRRVEEVLDVARLHEGAIDLAREPFAARTVIDSVADLMRESIEAGGNMLALEVDADLPVLVGDADRLRQVLLNLAANAAKFTTDGRIAIQCRLVARDGLNATVEFGVTDTGIGIPEPDQRRIFDDFVTLDAGYGRRTGGVGLGLAISRRIVDGMGGEIGVQSAPRLGSRFWVRLTFPVASTRIADRGMAGRGHVAARPLKVLLVEDNPTNRFVIREMLTSAGHGVIEACDGAEGVAAARDRRPDVILMDISMPGMDGVDATRAIRAAETDGHRPAIIALTAHALPEEMARFVAAGIDDCLTKPVRRAVLLEALSRSQGAMRPQTPADDADGDDDPLLDDEILADLTMSLSGDDMADAIAAYLRELESAHAAIADAARRGDDATVLRLAHRLGGASGLLGAGRLHRVLSTVQRMIKTGDAAAARAQAQGLGPVVAETRAALVEIAGDALAGQAATPAGAEVVAGPI
ncbi:MAG: ATP-binding protein [Rubrimonas sp.]